MNTLYLEPKTWDLSVDTQGNIAVATDPYSKAQDVASAIKLFEGELWFDTRQGVPHFEIALGKRPSYSLYCNALETAAKTVKGVTDAKAVFTLRDGRAINGQVLFTDEAGKVNGVTL